MSAHELIDMLATVENDPDVPAYARQVAAEAVRALEQLSTKEKE